MTSNYTQSCRSQKKRKFTCPICGPKMKSCHSKSLGKQVFDEYRHFLHKNHKHWIAKKHIFNGKEEKTSKPWRMTPHVLKLEYNRMNHWGNVTPSDVGFLMKFKFGYCLLFTNAIIDVREGCQGINEQLSKGLKSYPRQFSRLLYYKNLPIVDLLDALLERM